MKELLKELQEINQKIKKIYAKKSVIEAKIIEIMVERKEKEVVYNENEISTLVWVFDKKIDYEKLQKEYPQVYELGLYTSFSATRALKSMDSKLFNAILRDCTTVEPHYELKRKGKIKR